MIFQVLGLMLLNTTCFQYSICVHSPWILEGWSMHFPRKHRENDAMRFPRLGHKRPCSFHLVFWTTYPWNSEPPCKKPDLLNVAMGVRPQGEITWTGPWDDIEREASEPQGPEIRGLRYQTYKWIISGPIHSSEAQPLSLPSYCSRQCSTDKPYRSYTLFIFLTYKIRKQKNIATDITTKFWSGVLCSNKQSEPFLNSVSTKLRIVFRETEPVSELQELSPTVENDRCGIRTKVCLKAESLFFWPQSDWPLGRARVWPACWVRGMKGRKEKPAFLLQLVCFRALRGMIIQGAESLTFVIICLRHLN